MTHAIPDDFPSSSSTTGVLAVGTPLTARFEHLYDSDWVKVDLVAGKPYVFSMPAQAQGNGIVSRYSNVELELRGPDGASLWDESGFSHLGPAFEYTPKVSGTYFLAARIWGTDESNLGSYTLSAAIRPAGPDDFASNASTSGVLEAAGKATGTFEFSGDIDWFRFRAEAGKYYSFGSETKAPFVHTAGMRIFDSSGAEYPIYPFNPSVTGDYFVAVSSYEPGPYSIVSRLLVTDDYSDDMSTSGVLRPGAEITGAIQFRFDTDYIKTTFAAGVNYTFELGAHEWDISSLSVSLRNAAGDYFTVWRGSSTAGKIPLMFTAPAAGDYYFVIDGEQLSSGVTRSPYTLKWVGPTMVDDFANDRAGAGSIALGATINGVLDGGADTDVMKVALQAGKSYTFELKSRQAGTPVTINVANENGTLLLVETGEQNSHTFTAQTSGNYYVSVFTQATAGAPFTFKASAVTDDFGATAATAGQLVVGGSVSGNLTFGGGDRDWFAVTLTAGERYVFTTAGADMATADGMPVGRILDPLGNPLASSIDARGINGATVDFSPASSGKFFFELYSANHSGLYTIAARRITGDDFGNTSATAGRLTDNVWKSGELEVAGDYDSFKLAVTAGNQYVIEMKIDAAADPTYLHVENSAGFELLTQEFGGLALGDRYVVVQAESTGDLLITLDGQDNSGIGYAIKAYAVGRDDFAANGSTAGVVAINGQSKGVLEHWADEDMFRVSLTAGKSYVFELLGSVDNGGTLDIDNGSTFGLVGPNGVPVGYPIVSNSASPRIYYTAQASSDLYLLVNGLNRNAGTYTLKATDVSGDTSAPALASTSHAHGAVGASLTGDIVLTFNEAIQLTDNAIRLRDVADGGISSLGLRHSSLAIGNKLVIDPSATLRPGATYTLDLPAGSVLDYAGNPYAGVKSFTFTTIATSSAASAGNDLFTGLGRAGGIDGGAGVDTVVYSETMASYRVVRSNGDATVRHSAAAAGDALSGVERLLFADGAIALDIGGTAGQAYRLYQAAFDRVPDKDGLGYWMAQMDSGAALGAVAGSFVGSAEFKLLYGAAPTNAQFVELLYDNVLHRKGDQAGVDYWMSTLATGAGRDAVLAAFSESGENQAAVAAIIGNGFVYNPYG